MDKKLKPKILGKLGEKVEFLVCPFCNENNVYDVEENRTTTYQGTKVKYLDKHYLCMDCLEEFDTGESWLLNIQEIKKKYDELKEV